MAMLRGLDSNWARGAHGKAGLLVRYGAKDPKPLVTSVRCSRRELTTLLAARNVAAAIEKHNADALTETAPAVLGDGRGACARCYQSEACALRHFCVEGRVFGERFLVVIATNVLPRPQRSGFCREVGRCVERVLSEVVRFNRRRGRPGAPPDGAASCRHEAPEERRGDACAVLRK